jgi:hypothetical protein
MKNFFILTLLCLNLHAASSDSSLDVSLLSPILASHETVIDHYTPDIQIKGFTASEEDHWRQIKAILAGRRRYNQVLLERMRDTSISIMERLDFLASECGSRNFLPSSPDKEVLSWQQNLQNDNNFSRDLLSLVIRIDLAQARGESFLKDILQLHCYLYRYIILCSESEKNLSSMRERGAIERFKTQFSDLRYYQEVFSLCRAIPVLRLAEEYWKDLIHLDLLSDDGGYKVTSKHKEKQIVELYKQKFTNYIERLDSYAFLTPDEKEDCILDGNIKAYSYLKMNDFMSDSLKDYEKIKSESATVPLSYDETDDHILETRNIYNYAIYPNFLVYYIQEKILRTLMLDQKIDEYNAKLKQEHRKKKKKGSKKGKKILTPARGTLAKDDTSKERLDPVVTDEKEKISGDVMGAGANPSSLEQQEGETSPHTVVPKPESLKKIDDGVASLDVVDVSPAAAGAGAGAGGISPSGYEVVSPSSYAYHPYVKEASPMASVEEKTFDVPAWVGDLKIAKQVDYSKILRDFQRDLSAEVIKKDNGNMQISFISPVNGQLVYIYHHEPHGAQLLKQWPGWRYHMISGLKSAGLL